MNKKPIEKHTQLVLDQKEWDKQVKKCLLTEAIGKGGPSASRRVPFTMLHMSNRKKRYRLLLCKCLCASRVKLHVSSSVLCSSRRCLAMHMFAAGLCGPLVHNFRLHRCLDAKVSLDCFTSNHVQWQCDRNSMVAMSLQVHRSMSHCACTNGSSARGT